MSVEISDIKYRCCLNYKLLNNLIRRTSFFKITNKMLISILKFRLWSTKCFVFLKVNYVWCMYAALLRSDNAF